MKETAPAQTESRLKKELKRLKRKYKTGNDLELFWIPRENTKLSGRVDGTSIFIYEQETDMALRTLRHEFFDYEVSKLILPYNELSNKLIALVSEWTYREKERLVDKLCNAEN